MISHQPTLRGSPTSGGNNGLFFNCVSISLGTHFFSYANWTIFPLKQFTRK